MHNSIYRNVVWALGIAGMAVLGLQGCATSTSTDREGIAFPDPGDAWIEEGTYVNLEDLRKMQVGVSKDQIYDLLGRPHFSEGLFGVHEWNYIFQLPTGEGSYITCQYQVGFDDDMLTESLHWRELECAALLEPRKEPERMALAADTLFDYDSSELTNKGRREISGLTQRIREEFSSPEIVVMGYTDRLGRDAYNLALSERRAAEVRTALIDQGMAPTTIRSIGLGERNPLVQCPGSSATSGLKACLRPNRRVEVEVTERLAN
ncbi:OmpA family protein [Halomonas sp. I1]|uniref:OmpA family protein n=1 Tax=Halomonas sp. I1 TaxID=393536 RepID=UPI0028DD62A1|nr:OmpA family protein [Halomonas sp. I1]MDT8896612.1 OmpA family protein [Halomonas sp. I1]